MNQQAFEYGGYHFIPSRLFIAVFVDIDTFYSKRNCYKSPRRAILCAVHRTMHNSNVKSHCYNKADGDFFKITHNLRIDKELGFTAYNNIGYQKFKYSYAEFYEASSEKLCDIFICVENQKSYLPCGYELQEYIVD